MKRTIAIHSRLTSILLLVFLSLAYLSALDTEKHIVGKPRQYCIPEAEVIYPQVNDLELFGSTDWWKFSNNVKLRLTNNFDQVAAAWYKKRVDLKNDFRTTFNTSIDSWHCTYKDKSFCQSNMWGKCNSISNQSNIDKCGGEGMAFVLSKSSNNPYMSGGSMNGYGNLFKAFVVEFDTSYSNDQNDPWWSNEDDRHMSVMLSKTGQIYQLSNEVNSIVRNDRPLNWKNNFGSGYRPNVKVDIRLIDKLLEIFVDDILQIAYYENLDIPQTIGDFYFFAGFSASTSHTLKEDHYFFDWAVYITYHTTSSSYSTFEGIYPLREGFNLYKYSLHLKNSCGREHFPLKSDYYSNLIYQDGNEYWKSEFKLITIKGEESCQIKDIFVSSSQTYIGVDCYKIGDYEFKFQYKNRLLSNSHQIIYDYNPIKWMNLNFWNHENNIRSIDEVVKFSVGPFRERQGVGYEIANATVEFMRNSVSVRGPVPFNNSIDYNMTKQANLTWSIELTSNIIGKYLIFFVQNSVPSEFYLTTGNISSSTTSVTLVSTSNSTATKFGTVGDSYKLSIQAKDKGNNVIPNDKLNGSLLRTEIYCNGELKDTTNNFTLIGNQFTSTHKLNSTGNYNFKVFYVAIELSCQNCNVEMKSNGPNFLASSFYQFNNIKKEFEIVSNEVIMSKNSNSKVRFILTDNHGNQLDSIKIEDFTMSISGNEMKNLNLFLVGGGSSAIDGSICSGDDTSYFSRLAGIDGYSISITQLSINQTKTYNLSLKSDGSDADCGNDELNLERTETSWISQPNSGVWGYAGVTYTLKLVLKTTSMKRYCDWAVPTENITFRLLRGHTTGLNQDFISPASKYNSAGVYSIDINFKKASRVSRYIYFFLNGNSIQPRTLIIKETVAFMGYISDENIDSGNVLKDGVIEQSYSFTVFVFDKYDNPTKIANGNLDLAVTHQKNKDINLMPNCDTTELGNYYCVMTADKWGIYDIKSALFENNQIKAFKVAFYRTEPSFLVSTGRIINDLSIPFPVGAEMTYRIVPKDLAGDPFVKKETLKIFKNFAGNFIDPNGNVTDFNVTESVIDESGNLIFTHKHTIIGKYRYSATYNGNSIMCEVCIALVSSAEPDLSKSKFYILSTASEGFRKPIYQDQFLKLDNTISVPIFIVEFFDAFGNAKSVVSGYSTSISVLSVPKGIQNSYQFALWNNQGVVQFELSKKNLDVYKTELSNENCTLEFKLKSDNDTAFTTFLFKTVILIGKMGDDQFSNDPIDPAKIILDPSVIKIKANEQTTLKIELRTSNGKLYNHPATNGFFANTSKELLLGNNTLDQSFVSVVNGKLKGTYIFTFTSQKAMTTSNISVHFFNPDSKQMEVAKTNLSLEVIPTDYNFLVMNQQTLSDCVAGDNKAIESAPFDQFNNPIDNLDAEKSGLNAAQTNGEGKLGSVSSGKNKVGLAFSCQKAGIIKIEAPRFKEDSKYNARVISNYVLNVNPGAPSAAKSMAVVSKSDIVAGETVVWKVFPYDAFDNKITIDSNSSLYKTSEFTSKVVFKGEGIDIVAFKISNDKQYYYIEYILTKAGYHTFQAFHKGEFITAPSAKVNVNAIEASFNETALLKRNKDQEFELSIEKKFVHQANVAPTFKLNLFDKYQNAVDKIPNGWILSLRLSGVELKTNEILFCADNTGLLFAICQYGDHTKNYFDLVTNREYSMIFSNGKDSQTPYTIQIIGDKSDPEASNLPLNVSNTIITPNSPLRTTAHKDVSFNIELRTTNKNLRRNSWFENAAENITLSFSQNDKDKRINFLISEGDAKGRYVVFVVSKIAYTETNPNIITVSINNKAVTSNQPSLIVKPDVPANVVVTDINGKKTGLSVANIDNEYTTFFMASDQFGNDIILSSENSLNLAINLQNETYSFTKDYTNGIMKVVFQPKKAGEVTYTFDSLKTVFNVTLLQGSISQAKSYFTISAKTGTTIVAGNEAFVEFHPIDKWDNPLVLDNKYPDVKQMQLQLLLKEPTSSTYSVVSDKSEISTSSERTFAILSSLVKVKGQNEFSVQFNKQSVRGVLQVITVTPAQFNFANTKLEYFDDKQSKFIQAVKAKEISEDNVNETPILRIRPFDQFKNELDVFPCNATDSKCIGQFSILLYGNDYEKSTPITFVANKVEGNILSFALIDADKKRYNFGLFKSTPYNLDVTFTAANEPLPYSMALQGRGEGDKGAEIEKPMDITKTFFSALKAEFIAGTKSQLSFEIRTASGKRKSDAEPKFNLTFAPSDSSYIATVSNADLLGKYIITISGTKASEKTPIDVKISIDAKDCDKTIKVTINPDKVAKFSIESSLESGSADTPYNLPIKPYDQFMNTVFNADEPDVNLQIKFPESTTGVKGKTYTTTHDGETGIILYKIDATIVGEYFIKSEMIVGGNNSSFMILAGAPYYKYSTASVKPSQAVVNSQVSIDISPFDKFNNPILKANQPNAFKNFNYVVTWGKGEYKDFTISAGNNNLVSGTFTLTMAGMSSIVAKLNNEVIPCNGCNVNFIPGAIELPLTIFTQMKADGKVEQVSKVTMDAKSKNLNLRAQLFDKFSNLILGFTSNETFTFTLQGNSMIPIGFKVEKLSNILTISVSDDKSMDLSQLVPAKDYEIVFVQLNADKEIARNSMKMDILGQDTGAGNGPIALCNTVVKPTSVALIAGKEGSFTIELYQSEKKRFNGDCSKDFIKVEEEVGSVDSTGSEKLKIITSLGQLNCQYSISLYGEVALNEGQLKKISISINGTILSTQVTVDVQPNVIDFTKTIIVKSLNSTVMTDIEQEFSYKLFDSFKNQLSRTDFVNKLVVKSVNGNLNFNRTTLNAGIYSSFITPLYPPKYMAYNLYYTASANNVITILESPLSTSVIATLALQLTEVDDVSAAAGDSFKVLIKLKETNGYCFETSKKVSINIDGPYSDEKAVNKVNSFYKEVQDLVAITVRPSISNEISRASYSCHQYYVATVPVDSFTGKGYYQTNVYLEGENDGKSLKSLVKITMRAADIDSSKTKVALIKKPEGIKNDTVDELGFYVGNSLSINIILRDRFLNEIGENRNENVVLTPLGMKKEDFEMSQISKPNGNHEFSLIFKKFGSINSFNLTVNSDEIVLKAVEQQGFPKILKLYPGKCSTEKPGIDLEEIKTAKIVVNQKVFFNLQCYDIYGNLAEEQEYKFDSSFIANNIPVVKNIVIPGKVLPKGKATNKFTFGFKPTYAGEYIVNLILDGSRYGPEIKLNVTAGRCPLDTPTYCVNTKKCVAGGYKECGFSQLTCKGTDKPIKCTVYGDLTCVRHSIECDCEDENLFIKCMSDSKCVPAEKEPDLCATFFSQKCKKGEVQCDDMFSCRKDLSSCPSHIGCTPGYQLCPDQSCVVKGEKCPEFNKCPPSAWNKCEDQSCQNVPTNCPTRITCPDPTSVICPDKTCAPTELDCAQPNTCDGMYRCPDLSCRPSKQDCPVSTSCPSNYALCPDGVCRDSCKGTSNWRMLAMIEGSADAQKGISTTEMTGCPKGTSKCPGGECVLNIALCPTVESCPIGSVRCADLSCETSLSSCRSSTCKKGQTHCWDGSCVSGIEECPTRTTCPEDSPVKCQNGVCAETLSDCDEVVTCPKSASYKCGYGECRRKAIDCPTFVTCPPQLPIACVDGTCKKSSEDCIENTKLFECGEDQVLCPGGACAQSKDTCPTLESCPIGFIRCWDNDCAESIDKCDQVDPSHSLCPSDRPIRCNDGSCASKLINCPTQLICPPNKPIKCSDGNCRQSNEDCSKVSECPLGTNKCPDGSCSSSICGTAITCPQQTPIKCYDNTCRIDIRDCPMMPTCPSDKPVLCEDGICVYERANCVKTKKCPFKTPVKCPDNSCVESVDDCEATAGCPLGFTKCADTSCRRHSSLCSAVECPNNLFLCPNGLCAKGKEFCDQLNGCPFNKAMKCGDGSCTNDLSKCQLNPQCPEGQSLCKDGSCLPSNLICPEDNGCMLDTPFKCADGTCIDPQISKCKTLACPAEKPTKCLDGTCVSSNRNCPNLISKEKSAQCESEVNEGNLIPCADGSCVTSADQCRPLFECPENFERCDDGSCKPSKSLCPLAKSKCPSSKSFVCSNGVCAKSDIECIGANGCPHSKPQKCKYSGVCMESLSKCDELDKKGSLRNGCTLNKPFKCSDDSCVSKKKNCSKKSKCSDDKPFLCFDGSCGATKKECQIKQVKCKDNEFICPDNKCAASFSACKTSKGCPFDKPFNCEEGCSKSKCNPNVKCPPQSPFKCLDGTCVGSSSFCNIIDDCEGDNVRCADGTCKPSLNDCELEICPVNVFVRCNDGKCVSSPEECGRFLSLKCQDDKPIRCLNGECASKFSDCLGGEDEIESVNKKRLLESTESTCSTKYQFQCPYGNCVKSQDQCDFITGCGMTKPYRCQTGVCVKSQGDCVEDRSLRECVVGTTRCADGVCRFKCLPHAGCPLSKPLLCANGFCANSPTECKMNYNCDNDLLVRCFDGTCRSKVEDCPKILSLSIPDNVDITSTSYKAVSFEFIQNGKSSVKLGSISIPAAALNLPIGYKPQASFEEDLKPKIITIQPFPDSVLRKDPIFKAEDNAKLQKTFGKNTNGNLYFHQAVRSSLFKLASNDRPSANYRYAMSVSLATQKYVNTDDYDYCLAELNINVFNCVSRSSKTENIGDLPKLTFNVAKDGVYAVVYSPTMSKPDAAVATAGSNGVSVTKTDCGYWCQNTGFAVLLILMGITLISLLVLSLIGNGYLNKKYTITANELKQYKNSDIESNAAKVVPENAEMMEKLSDKNTQIDIMRQREAVLEQEVHDLREKVKNLAIN